MSRDYEQEVIKAAVKWAPMIRMDISPEANDLRKKTTEYLEWINGGTVTVDAATGEERRDHEYGPHSSGD